jgi:hypothetical protein
MKRSGDRIRIVHEQMDRVGRWACDHPHSEVLERIGIDKTCIAEFNPDAARGCAGFSQVGTTADGRQPRGDIGDGLNACRSLAFGGY